MSNRRKPKQARRQKRAAGRGEPATERSAADELEGLMPWIWAMQDADEAERIGDAAGALAAIERRMIGPDGRVYWRPSRLQSLQQLVALEAHLPAWVRSRWILAQAAHHLGDPGDHAAQARTRRSVQVAAALHGGMGQVPGIDKHDKSAQLHDHDWVWRQVHLWEQEGLQAFLRSAPPDLLSGADRIEEWASAPMGGYLFCGASGNSLLWWDLAGPTVVKTLNIGTATGIPDGARVIGRVVPAADGLVFEGPPLVVPDALARAVAQDPASWLKQLQGAEHQLRDGTIRVYEKTWRSVVSDAPFELVSLMLSIAGVGDGPARTEPAEVARAALDLGHSLLERQHEAEQALEDQEQRDDCHDDQCEGEDCDCDLEIWDADPAQDLWAYLHAALLDPVVMAAVPGILRAEDVEMLDEVQDHLAEPARSWAASLATSAHAAA